jgi:hypothetical protein
VEKQSETSPLLVPAIPPAAQLPELETASTLPEEKLWDIFARAMLPVYTIDSLLSLEPAIPPALALAIPLP